MHEHVWQNLGYRGQTESKIVTRAVALLNSVADRFNQSTAHSLLPSQNVLLSSNLTSIRYVALLYVYASITYCVKDGF
jgi:hypothetical protein